MTHPGLQPSSPERLNPRSDAPHINASRSSDAEAARSYVAALRRRWKLVVAIPVALAVIAGTLSFLRPRPYAARAAFLSSEPSSLGGSLGALGTVASQLGIPALSAVAQNSATLSTQFYGDLLTSNAVLHAIVTTPFDASAVAENGGKPFKGTLIDYYDATGKTQTDRELATMDAVAHGMLIVNIDRGTGVVRFEVRTRNRQLSALVARQILDLVNEFNLKRRQTQAGAEREFTARRARAALDTLRVAESALADFRATNIDFSRSPRLANRETELQRRVALAQQIYTTVAQRSELANIEAVRNTPVITVLDAPEGLVMAMPRFTRQIALGAFLFGLVIAAILALVLERSRLGAGVEPQL